MWHSSAYKLRSYNNGIDFKEFCNKINDSLTGGSSHGSYNGDYSLQKKGNKIYIKPKGEKETVLTVKEVFKIINEILIESNKLNYPDEVYSISLNLGKYPVEFSKEKKTKPTAVTPEPTMLANKQISELIEYLKQDIPETSPKKASTARKIIDTKKYPGAKGGSGVIQKIINQVPKGTVTIIDGCIGSGTFSKNILPAEQNIGIDIDENVINYLNAHRSKEKLQHVELVQYDIIKYLRSLKGKRLDNASTVIYLDPPYPKSARRGQRDLYNYEMSDLDHVSLLTAVQDLKCRIIISTYENDLYNEHLKGWRLETFKTTHRAGTAIEYLYCNFPQPKELHDTRYVGNNFRERERIKRKGSRWVKNLEEMPDLERQYIIELMRNKNLV
jgi:16S rRNA G966 N2-methylase RsmD